MSGNTTPPPATPDAPRCRVAIFGNRHQDGCLEGIGILLDVMAGRGITPVINPPFHSYLAGHGIMLPPCAEILAGDNPYDGIRAAVSIGGDGTFLRAARRLGDSGVPLVGVNTGHLGFLVHYTLDEAGELADMLCLGHARIEERMVLCVEAPDMPSDVWPYALNEVAILKEETSSMISVRVDIDGHFLADYQADGLVVATPTGSTAYNLAAGGPLLQPTLDCMALSPVAPHTLTMRPLVTDGGSVLQAMTTSRASRYRLSLDGCGFPMECGTSVRIRRAPFTLRVIIRPGTDFASALRHKLLWGRR